MQPTMDICSGWSRTDGAIGSQPGKHGRKRRKLVEGVWCPRCHSEAIYRYGKTASGRKRYLCQVCHRQFSLKPPGRLEAEERPACPACGKPMHVYMHKADCIRFRCADYPRCRTFIKQETEAHRIHARLLSLRARSNESQESDAEIPPQRRERG